MSQQNSLNALLQEGLSVASDAVAESTKKQVHLRTHTPHTTPCTHVRTVTQFKCLPPHNTPCTQFKCVYMTHANGTYLLQYERTWKEWQYFCTWHKIDALNATPENIVAYLVYTAKRSTGTVANAYTHLSAIAYQYKLHNLPSITDTPLVTMYMRGLKRRNLDVPVKRAKPMDVDVLVAMRRLLVPDARPNLVTWRTVWRSHMEFGLLLRFDDVRRLMVCDVTFDHNADGPFMRLSLRGGKTIMSHGSQKNERLITPSATESCLFTLTQR
jgi:hypothetical protein